MSDVGGRSNDASNDIRCSNGSTSSGDNSRGRRDHNDNNANAGTLQSSHAQVSLTSQPPVLTSARKPLTKQRLVEGLLNLCDVSSMAKPRARCAYLKLKSMLLIESVNARATTGRFYFLKQFIPYQNQSGD